MLPPALPDGTLLLSAALSVLQQGKTGETRRPWDCHDILVAMSLAQLRDALKKQSVRASIINTAGKKRLAPGRFWNAGGECALAAVGRTRPTRYAGNFVLERADFDKWHDALEKRFWISYSIGDRVKFRHQAERHVAGLAMKNRTYIGFDEIATRSFVGEKPDIRLQKSRLGALIDSFKNGEFIENANSVVIHLANVGVYDDPRVSWEDHMASELLGSSDPKHSDDVLMRLRGALQVPRLHALRWFNRHNISLPVGWFPSEADGALLPPIDTKPDRPVPTNAAIEAWQSSRQNGWPDNLPPPSEERDWAAVRAEFGDGLRRDDYRKIREKIAPPEWQTQGPRRAWGVSKKLRRNSAKLPPQK